MEKPQSGLALGPLLASSSVVVKALCTQCFCLVPLVRRWSFQYSVLSLLYSENSLLLHSETIDGKTVAYIVSKYKAVFV